MRMMYFKRQGDGQKEIFPMSQRRMLNVQARASSTMPKKMQPMPASFW